MDNKNKQIDSTIEASKLPNFIGRQEELKELRTLVESSQVSVTLIQGSQGIGKSALLREFGATIKDQCSLFTILDCRLIEPTSDGFLSALARMLDNIPPDTETIANAINALPDNVVLCLDHFETFLLMDTWLRTSFLPRLSGTVTLIIATRRPPLRQWFLSHTLAGKVRSLSLQPLTLSDAKKMLLQEGISEEKVNLLAQRTHGNPLALRLAIAATLANINVPDSAALQDVMQELTDIFLSEIANSKTRNALENCSVVRRVTKSILRTITNIDEGEFETFRQLPFVDSWPDGLRFHGAVQEAISSTLRATDPERYYSIRRAAWTQLRKEMRLAPSSELWRTTADMLYLVENKVVREAFFPTTDLELAVEPALEPDWEEIQRIIQLHDGEEGLLPLFCWWKELPNAFHVVRSATGKIVAFYCMSEARYVESKALLDGDPVVAAWKDHLHETSTHHLPQTLFLRRWLSLQDGEVPSAGQAACWIDVKRSYLELRPTLRRAYLTLKDLGPYLSIASQLGFTHLPQCARNIGEGVFETAMLDFGPESVDGWISQLAGEEMGIASDTPINHQRQCLEIDTQEVTLTPLEYKLVSYLEGRSGTTATRDQLLTEVWGHIDTIGSSNVVDSVVKTLRQKLGPFSPQLETVRGFGYRWNTKINTSSN